MDMLKAGGCRETNCSAAGEAITGRAGERTPRGHDHRHGAIQISATSPGGPFVRIVGEDTCVPRLGKKQGNPGR